MILMLKIKKNVHIASRCVLPAQPRRGPSENQQRHHVLPSQMASSSLSKGNRPCACAARPRQL